MARIPIADQQVTLGGRVAATEQSTAPSARAFGAGAGQVLEQQAGQAAAEERQRILQEQREFEIERRQREAEARRVKALTVTARVQNSLAELGEQIGAGLQDGSVDKTTVPQQFKERSDAIINDSLQDVDEDNRDLVRATLLNDVNRAGVGVRRMVEARDQADIQQGTRAWLEEMQRFAARGGADADTAIAKVAEFIPSVAGRAGLDAQKTVQAFRENVRFRQASDLVLADPAAATRNLRNKDWLPDLDPDRRGALMATAESRLETMRRRAEADAERVAKAQDRTFQGAMAIFESGRTFTPEYAAQLTQALRGSPYEGALRQMVMTAPQNIATATKSIEQQRAELDRLRAEVNVGGADPARLKELERREKLLRAADSDAGKDPLGAVLERGLIDELPPLNVADLRGLPQALAERREAAGIAAQWAGRPVSPLRQQEAEQVARVLQGLPPEQKAPALAAIGSALGDRDQIAALARQIDSNDRTLATAMMYANTRSTQGRYVSEVILRGEQARKDGRVKVDTARETGWKAAIATQIGDAYADQELRQRYIDSAMSIAIGLAADGDADISRAVRLATGGIRTQADDTKVPLPYGWTDREFDRGLREYPAGRLPEQLRVGDVAMSRDDFRARLPDALLVHAGQGRYRVRAGAGFVTDPQGRPVVLDFAAQ